MSSTDVKAHTFLGRMNPEIGNLRDFLVSLPKLASFKYNDTLCYFLWKTLSKCITIDHQNINWKEEILIFETDNWRNGVYESVRLPDDWRDAFFEDTKGNEHRGSACNKQCHPTETVYYCFDCTKNPLYEVCEECFDKTKHVNHRYTSRVVTRPEGRVCHCGDPSGFNDSRSAYKCKNESNNQPIKLSYDDNRPLLSTFSQLLDYLIDAVIYLKELYDEPSRTLMANSKGILEAATPECALQLYESDCGLHIKDLAKKISTILNKPTEYGVMMVSRLQKGYSFVNLVESYDVDKLKVIQETFKTENIPLHLKKTSDIFKEYLIDDLVLWLYKICSHNPSMTIKLSLRVSMCDQWNSRLLSTKYTPGTLNPFILKISLLGGFVVPYEQRDTFPWCKSWNFPHQGDQCHDPRITHIMHAYDRRIEDTNVESPVARFSPFHGSRFQYLLTEGTSLLPKLSKFRLLKALCCIFTIGDDSRNCLAAQYLDIYPTLLYNTVASDSLGYKVSLMSVLSQYIFQNPRIANMIIPSGFIERVTQFAFTLMSFLPEELMECPPVPLFRDFRLPDDTIKNKRTVICFKDIYLVMSTNTVPEKLLANDAIVQTMVNCFSAFNNILPLKRETTEHVEFENFDFSSFYFFFSSILVMIDGFTRNICLLQNPTLRKSVVGRFLRMSLLKEFKLLKSFRTTKLDPSYPGNAVALDDIGLPVVNEMVCNSRSQIIKFQVGIDTQNFFNPMSYFIKFVLQWSQCGRYEPLSKELTECLDFREFFDDTNHLNWISESALSTLVLISQIGVGFWVRNGSPVQHQLRMYTKYSMREFTYFSDIFMIQFSMSFCNPTDFMVTYLTRWGLKNWSEGIPMGDYPDDIITASMVDQCLLLLIQLLSEVRSLTMKSSIEGFEKTMQVEIVHALCFKNSSHTDIVNSIPEHVTKHPAFDLYLESLTNYIPPAGLTDSGIYSLKKEYYSTVDPYFIGFQPSKRYEAEKLVRKHMAKEKKINYGDTFVPAKYLSDTLKNTPYVNLYQISNTEIFGVFLKNTLDHIKKFNYEVMLSKAVHLIHLCMVNNTLEFSKIFWREYATDETELYYYNSIGSLLYSFLLREEFSNEHGKIREIFSFLHENAPHVNIEDFLKEQTPSFVPEILTNSVVCSKRIDEEFEKKKKLARAKRDKVMKRIAKQQQQFIANNQTPFDEEICDRSETLQKGTAIGWRYPECSCVFCKMHRDDDAFVYFTYLERNACDQVLEVNTNEDISYSFEAKIPEKPHNELSDAFTQEELNAINSLDIKRTIQKPVLRTCGHGAHISCLMSHMKSARTIHNHITKNVPISLGFSLMFCPLCSALTNSFLPCIVQFNSRRKDALFHSEHFTEPESPSTLLLSSCVKSIVILQTLLAEDSTTSTGPVDTLCRLLTDTLSNAEICYRFSDSSNSGSFIAYKINNQHLLTLRLLSEMKRFLMSNEAQLSCLMAKQFSSFITPFNITDWKAFTEDYVDCDLLCLANFFIQPAKNNIRTSDMLHELIKKRLHQELLLISKKLFTGSRKFFCILALAQDHEVDSNVEGEVLALAEILNGYLPLFTLTGESLNTTNLATILFPVYKLIQRSLTVFLRRVAMMVHADYPINFQDGTYLGHERELDNLLDFCHLPSFKNILVQFQLQDMTTALGLASRQLSKDSGASFAKKLENISIYYAGEISLIDLPYNLSHFSVNDDDHIRFRANKEETAICLFCGTKVEVQNSVPIHNFSIGECTNHSLNECQVNSTYGCFLLVRSNTVYLAYDRRGTFYRAPYLNRHGETDEDYRNGTPVFLNTKRYSHLSHDIVFGNMIPHLVFRLTDTTSDLGGWESM